jgi:hypothetical protein
LAKEKVDLTAKKVPVIPWEKSALRIKTRTAMMEKVKMTGEL